MTANIVNADSESIKRAAEIIKSGGIVAMPTETVYGLAGDAYNDRSVAKIYTAKGRPSFNPLIAHVCGIKMAEEIVEFNGRARILADRFWPGPLTLILPKKAGCRLSELACAGNPTSAVRCPDHKTAAELIRTCGVPLVAPSANASGSVSPTTPAAVYESLGNNVDMILASGKTKIGVESTITDLSGDKAVILRPGSVTKEMIEEALGETVYFRNPTDDVHPNAPGQLKRHYATETKLRLNAVDVKAGEALLAFGKITFMAAEGYGGANDMPKELVYNLSESGDLEEAAANLFMYLREMDKLQVPQIAVMPVPHKGLGVAINDRLSRAAVPKG